MKLSCRILESVSGVNSYDHAEQARFTQGDTPTIYLQLIDASRDRPDQGFSPAGRRYVPAVGATLSVVFDSINNAKRITRVASQPFAGDPSIWAVPVLPTDGLYGTINLKLTLTEGVKVTYGYAQAAVAVESLSGLIL